MFWTLDSPKACKPRQNASAKGRYGHQHAVAMLCYGRAATRAVSCALLSRRIRRPGPRYLRPLYDDMTRGTKRPKDSSNLKAGFPEQSTEFSLRPLPASNVDHHFEVIRQEGQSGATVRAD